MHGSLIYGVREESISPGMFRSAKGTQQGGCTHEWGTQEMQRWEETRNETYTNRETQGWDLITSEFWVWMEVLESPVRWEVTMLGAMTGTSQSLSASCHMSVMGHNITQLEYEMPAQSTKHSVHNILRQLELAKLKNMWWRQARNTK